jgi:hypothetical protein
MAKKKYKGFQQEDGTIVSTAYFNGYAFGDRLLEGVMFKAEVKQDGTLKVTICLGQNDYFKGLNKAKWLKEAYKHATDEMNSDGFNEFENETGEDLVLI